jgi:hypothetical protein
LNARAGNVGAVVVVAMMVLGFSIVGRDPSDIQMHFVFWPAFLAGIFVVMVMVHRDGARKRRDR